ncbi:MAG: PAS domain S-box protein [bacterium]
MNNKIILIVEDDDAHFDLIQRNLESESSLYKIVRAKSISEAKYFILNNKYIIILTDWRLPDGEGIELFNIGQYSKKQPLVLMTSYGNENLAVEAIKLGALDYIVKSPETFNNLHFILQRAIREWELYVEKENIQAELQKSEEMLRAIYDNAKDIIFIKNSNFEYTVVNKAFAELHQKSIKEIIGVTDKKILNSNELNYINSIDIRVLNGESVDEQHSFIINNKSTVIHTVKSPLFNKNGEIIGICGIGRDITERIKADTDLRKLSQAVEQSPAGIIITDINGIIEYVNPRLEELTGYTVKELTGKKPNILRSGDKTKEEYKSLWDIILSGNKWFGEMRNIRKTGEFYWAMTSIAPIKDNNGNIMHFIGVQEDITEKIKFEKELILAKEKAIKSEKVKSEFLAQMSHEIRTPINALLSFSGLLKSEIEDEISEDLKNIFEYMESSGKRIIRTIDLLLNMSELQSGSFEISPKNFDLQNRIIHFVYQENVNEAKKKGLAFEIINDLIESKIYADEYSTHQIISNLVENAIKFTPSGSITLHIKSVPNNAIVMEVMDTGIGISEEYMDSLFTPFTQEEQGYSRKFEGNGLGLAIVKRYCELNNAKIEVESKKGFGSTFRVIFPNK